MAVISTGQRTVAAGGTGRTDRLVRSASATSSPAASRSSYARHTTWSSGSGRGRARGRTTRARPRPAGATATAATSSTATATGASRRSSPTSTPAATRSTSRSRTGSTTSTSARSSAPPTRSSRPGCTSSAGAAGTVAARWSPTATSTCGTTPTSTTSPAWAAAERLPLIGDRQPARLGAARDGRPAAGVRARCSARRARGSREPARAACDAGALDRPVRLDPLDQRRGGCGDRHAHLGPPARRPATPVVMIGGSAGSPSRIVGECPRNRRSPRAAVRGTADHRGRRGRSARLVTAGGGFVLLGVPFTGPTGLRRLGGDRLTWLDRRRNPCCNAAARLS